MTGLGRFALTASEDDLRRLLAVTDGVPSMQIVVWLLAWARGEREEIPDFPQGDGEYLPATPTRVARYFEEYTRIYPSEIYP